MIEQEKNGKVVELDGENVISMPWPAVENNDLSWGRCGYDSHYINMIGEK